jgi:hypothetical protein
MSVILLITSPKININRLADNIVQTIENHIFVT